jgi:GMP synthase-like glutamine amidotransferase
MSMIWYVDIEHEDILRSSDRAPNHFKVRDERAERVGQAAGMPCEAIHFTEVSQELADARGVKAITISGNCTDWEHYDFAQFQPLLDLVRGGTRPVLAFCGGHQLLGMAYDTASGPLGPLPEGITDDKAHFMPGMAKEVGYMPVEVVAADPLFEGLGPAPVFLEYHYWEVKHLPIDFELLARTTTCTVQAMRHRRYPIYGTQFHPEAYDAEHEDGQRLLRNFFHLAGVR